MEEAAAYHAKHPGQKFEPDGEGKRRELSDAAEAAAERWIGPHYRQLERTAGASD